jgi:hypothetical protein
LPTFESKSRLLSRSFYLNQRKKEYIEHTANTSTDIVVVNDVDTTEAANTDYRCR